jgi:hypothetical protein
VIDHINSDRQLGYTVIKILACAAFSIVNRGFIGLAILFENSLLKQAAYVMAIVVPALYISDIIFIDVFSHDEIVYEVYTACSILVVGAISLIFSLTR